MDYQKHYQLLISKANHTSGYLEEHHIIPKCLGGTDDASNLKKLTAREHYVAHLLLAKIHGGTLWHAVNLMGRLKKYSNREYERARIEHSKLLAAQNKRTKTKPKELRNYTCTNCRDDLVYEEFCHRAPKEHYYCDAKCRNNHVAKTRPSQVGKKYNRVAPAWNKGINNPLSADNARKGAAKLASKVTGRTRLYREDGSWTWQYPNK